MEAVQNSAGSEDPVRYAPRDYRRGVHEPHTAVVPLQVTGSVGACDHGSSAARCGYIWVCVLYIFRRNSYAAKNIVRLLLRPCRSGSGLYFQNGPGACLRCCVRSTHAAGGHLNTCRPVLNPVCIERPAFALRLRHLIQESLARWRRAQCPAQRQCAPLHGRLRQRRHRIRAFPTPTAGATIRLVMSPSLGA
jgi:hypothetical protein